MKKQRGIFEKIEGSGVWWLRFVDGSGTYRREVAGTFSQAKNLLTKRRNEALQKKKLPETLRKRTITFAEIAEDALRYSEQHKRDHRNDQSRMKVLKEWFGGRAADSLTTTEIENRLSDTAAAEKWKPSTYNHYRSLLMLVYREARRAEKITVNPARDVRHRKEDNNRVRFLTDVEEKRLREAIQTHYAEHLPEFELSLSSGLRKGSMYSLTWEMVDWTGRMLNIPISKNGEALHIPLNNAALAALRIVYQRGEKTGRVFQSEKTGKPLANSRHWFEDALGKAKITDFVWHDLRHCFATKLRMKGAKLEDIGELLGHKSLTMTKRYAHLGPNQLHEVAALLNSDSTPVAPATKPETTASASFVN